MNQPACGASCVCGSDPSGCRVAAHRANSAAPVVPGSSIVTWVVRAAMPWLMIMLVFLVIVTYVPWISLVLPDMIFGK